MRRAMPKTKPFTTRAATLILYELQRIKDAGHDANAALDQSTMRGWADVYPAKAKEIAKAERTESADDYARRKAEEAMRDRSRATRPPAMVHELLKRRTA
jgi:hypothetical protein